MQTKGKKILSLLLALALLVSVIPVQAQAAPTGAEEDGTYTIPLIDPVTSRGFDLTNPAPVTFTHNDFEQIARAQAKVVSRTYEVTKQWGQDSKLETFPAIALQVYGQAGTGDKVPLAQADGRTKVNFTATGHENQTGKAVFIGPKVDHNGAFYTYSFKEVGEAGGQVTLAGKAYTVSYDTAQQTITNSRVPETYTFTITKDTKVSIDYKDAPTPPPAQENHTVTIPADGNLAIENPSADGKYPAGKEITFKVNPPEGKEVEP